MVCFQSGEEGKGEKGRKGRKGRRQGILDSSAIVSIKEQESQKDATFAFGNKKNKGQNPDPISSISGGLNSILPLITFLFPCFCFALS